MATRPQLRAGVRARLEDAAASPLWDDAALNEFLAAAVRAYGVRFPVTRTAITAAVGSGQTSVLLPAGVAEDGVVLVRDPAGGVVPRLYPETALLAGSGSAQGWTLWGGQLRFARPTRGSDLGVWSIDHRAGREAVADEISQQPIEPGDEPIVVLLACAEAVERRAVEDAKRGSRPVGLAAIAEGFRERADGLVAARKRRARGGVLVAT